MSRARSYLSARFTLVGVLAAASLLGEGRALALQPLSAFIAAAPSHNTDAKIALLTVDQQQADALTALGRTLPAASARVVYSRNQFESKLDPASFAGAASPLLAAAGAKPIVIQPYNQLDTYLALDVPIIDVAGWTRTAAARANARAAAHTARATLLDVEKQIALNYYQLIGAEALAQAAERTLAAAEQSLLLTRERQGGGVATALDVDRARAEVERARTNISDAELSAELARRALQTLSGLALEGGAAAPLDDLQEESPLATFEARLPKNPAVAAAMEQRRAADHSASAAKLALLPTLSGSAQEHLTNAAGFIGHDSVWLLQATASIRVDVTTFGTMQSQSAAAAIAATKAQAAAQRALDHVHDSWFRVHNGIAKSRAARAEAEAADAAVARARDRFREGAGTELELVQAERDAFSATVSRIQADADLSYARAALRLDAGAPLGPEVKR